MVAIKKELTEIQMSFDLTDCVEGEYTVDPTSVEFKQLKEQRLIDAIHEVMGGKLLGEFICITKDNEEKYLKAYAEAKHKLHLSQFRHLANS